MGAPGLTEGLDHGDAGGELEHRGGDLGQLAVHLGGLGWHGAQHDRVGEHVERDRRHREQAQAPVEVDGVAEHENRCGDRVEDVHGCVGDHGVNRGGVVLNRLADPAGGGFGEPAQRRLGKAGQKVAAGLVAQPEVDEVRDRQAEQHEEDSGEEGADEDVDDELDAGGVQRGTALVVLQEGVTQRYQRHVGGDGEGNADEHQDLGDGQAAPDGPLEPGDGCLASLVLVHQLTIGCLRWCSLGWDRSVRELPRHMRRLQ